MKTYRIFFAKRGALIFVSHLDFSHAIVRAMKRAGLPLKYSEGFSPHPKIVFGLPLSVGMTGENEILDVTLDSDDISFEELKTRLEGALTKDFEIKKIAEPDIKLGKIKSAEYIVDIPDYTGNADRIRAALENPPIVKKRTKSGGEKELDIKPMTENFEVSEKDGATLLKLRLSASGDNYLNPEYVIASLNAASLCIPEENSITRTAILFE